MLFYPLHRKRSVMARPRRLLLVSLLLLGGCQGSPVQQQTDRIVRDMSTVPFDQTPLEAAAAEPKAEASEPAADIQTVALMQAERNQDKPADRPKFALRIPAAIPGSEVPPIPPNFGQMTPEQKEKTIRQLYPELPPLPTEPTPQPGPNGRPYTLADFQRMATE